MSILSIIIYARYSTENQNPKSVEDQISYCKEYLCRLGKFEIVSIFFDHAETGKIFDRKGLKDLIDFISCNKVDVVAFESQDRLCRNSGDTHRLHDIFKYYNIRMYSINEGWLNELMIGIKGTMNSIFIDETKARVIRSHRELAKKGYIPGGLAYGYKKKNDAVDETGKYRNGVREINAEQAKVVQRIFKMYADGAGSKAIAQRLNAEGIPSPSGGYWTSSSILGTKSREGGILGNNIYRGRLIYNRSKKITNPITQRTKNVMKPRDEWIEKDVPEMRIVSDELWNIVQSRRLSPKKVFERPPSEISRSASNKHLSGLVYCGICGAKSHRANYRRYVCGSYRNQKGCRNARGVVEDVIFKYMFDKLAKCIKNTNFKVEFEAFFEENKKQVEQYDKELLDIDSRIKGYSYVIQDGVYLEEISNNLKKLQSQRAYILSKVSNNIPEMDSEELIKKELIQGLFTLSDQANVRGFAPSWRAAMSLIVDKVITTPIPNKRRGMTIEVKIAGMEGWAEFYRRITAKKATG